VENVNLTGHFLIAMPAMQDQYFAKSVTYICEHNSSGALGIVINQPLSITLSSLLSQLNLDIHQSTLANEPVFLGGPVQTERGFVIHQPTGDWDCTIAVNDEIAITSSKDILESLANGQGPEKVMVSLGYAGWSAGQLEEEIIQNAWLTVKASEQIIFDTPANQRFDAAIKLLGIDISKLSEVSGHA
jgi:putative transcriptional regulator